MLVQKVSLTQNLSGTNAITLLSYINLTSSSTAPAPFPSHSLPPQIPLITVWLDPEASSILHYTNRSFCRKRKTAQTLFLPTFQRLFSSDKRTSV